jgi:hypothetical protein
LKRPSSDQDVCVEQSLLARDFNAEEQATTGGFIFKLLATDLVSFSSSLYSKIKKDCLLDSSYKSRTLLNHLLLGFWN